MDSGLDAYSLIEKAREIVRDAGGVGELDFSDGMQYLGTEKRPYGKDFRAKVHLDFPPSVSYCNYHGDGEWHTEILAEPRTMTPAERDLLHEKIKAERADAERAREEKALAAQRKAARLYAAAVPASKDFPYLARKRVLPVPGLRQTMPDGQHAPSLVMPVWNSFGTLVSLQFIDADGGKRFLGGGNIKGAYFPIRGSVAGRESAPLLICEGLATGITLFQCLGNDVACALNCGNLLPVGRALRQKFPNRELVFCADNDCENVGADGLKENVGVLRAQGAATACGGLVAVPPSLGGRNTDFNDLYCAEKM